MKYEQSKFGKPERPRKSGAYLICNTCKKEFYVFNCRLKKGMVKYCSKKCYNKSGVNNPFYGKKHSQDLINKFKNNPNRPKFTKENNPNIIRYADGKYIGKSNVWWLKWMRKNIRICEYCRFNDIRIMELHHKDLNRRNNCRENLLLLCPNCHQLIHYLNRTGKYKWKKS